MLGFSTPDFALVAYAEVFGADGNSTTMNSGVLTTRIGQGQYTITLPSNLGQPDSLSMVYVQPRGNPSNIAFGSMVVDTSDFVKTITLGTNTTQLDCSFSVCVWRSVIAPPSGSSS